jgi:hypothetical protein
MKPLYYTFTLALGLAITQTMSFAFEGSQVAKLTAALQGQAAGINQFSHSVILSSKERVVAVLPGTEYGMSKGDNFKLERGSVLVASEKAMTIDTGDAKFKVEAGRAMLVRKTEHGITVTNIDNFEEDCTAAI